MLFDGLRRDYTRFDERQDVDLDNLWLWWGQESETFWGRRTVSSAELGVSVGGRGPLTADWRSLRATSYPPQRHGSPPASAASPKMFCSPQDGLPAYLAEYPTIYVLTWENTGQRSAHLGIQPRRSDPKTLPTARDIRDIPEGRVVGVLPAAFGRETDQNRGRSTVRAPGDPPAPPGADLRVRGGVPLVRVPKHCLGGDMIEPPLDWMVSSG